MKLLELELKDEDYENLSKTLPKEEITLLENLYEINIVNNKKKYLIKFDRSLNYEVYDNSFTDVEINSVYIFKFLLKRLYSMKFLDKIISNHDFQVISEKLNKEKEKFINDLYEYSKEEQTYSLKSNIFNTELRSLIEKTVLKPDNNFDEKKKQLFSTSGRLPLLLKKTYSSF